MQFPFLPRPLSLPEAVGLDARHEGQVQQGDDSEKPVVRPHARVIPGKARKVQLGATARRERLKSYKADGIERCTIDKAAPPHPPETGEIPDDEFHHPTSAQATNAGGPSLEPPAVAWKGRTGQSFPYCYFPSHWWGQLGFSLPRAFPRAEAKTNIKAEMILLERPKELCKVAQGHTSWLYS